MQVHPSSQTQLDAEITEEKQLETTVTSINRDRIYQHTQSSIYVDEHEELCYVLSSN